MWTYLGPAQVPGTNRVLGFYMPSVEEPWRFTPRAMQRLTDALKVGLFDTPERQRPVLDGFLSPGQVARWLERGRRAR